MERDVYGRFAPGNAGGTKGKAGRPPRSIEEANLFAFRDGITVQQVQSMRDALYKRAVENNDNVAAKTWLEYAIGAPPQQIDHNLWNPAQLAAFLSDSPSGGSTSGDD